MQRFTKVLDLGAGGIAGWPPHLRLGFRPPHIPFPCVPRNYPNGVTWLNVVTGHGTMCSSAFVNYLGLRRGLQGHAAVIPEWAQAFRMQEH